MLLPLSALLADTAAISASDSDPRSRRSGTTSSSTRDAYGRIQSSAVPTSTLPRLSAVLGPTPPSAPLNLARWVVQVSSLPPFESSLPRAGAEAGIREKEDTPTATPAVPHTRALIITGPRATYHASLEDEDEPHLRGVARTDARVDVRYCPSARHARLLLALLSSSGAAACADTGAGRAGSASAGGSESGLARVYDIPLPSVVILHDLLGLFEENDENRPPGTGPFAATPAASYLDLIAAARSATTHLACPLVVLEPRATDGLALPILAGGAGVSVPASAREKRVPLDEALRWILGCVVRVRVVKPDEDGRPSEADHVMQDPDTDTAETRYVVRMDDADAFFCRRRVGRAEFAGHPEGEGGWAWAWEWTTV